MKIHSSLPMIGAAVLFSVFQAQGASSLSFGSTVQISSNSNFDLSVHPGKAAYDGDVSGAFGDGTVEAFYFVRNGGGGTLDRYADGGTSVMSVATNTATAGSADFERGDVWTDTDPGTLSGGIPDFSSTADFGGSTATISGGYEVSGTIDLEAFESGTVYVLCGGWDNAFKVDLTMSGPGQTDIIADSGSIDPPSTRNLYVVSFTFDNSDGDYDQISYDYTGSVSNRSRFMGVVVDATLAPGVIFWSGIGSSNVTASTADASADVNTALTDSVLVWDTADQGDSSTGDWPNSNTLGSQSAGPVSGQLTGLSADTEYTWRLYGTDGAGEAWTGPQTFTTPLTAAQAPAFTTSQVVADTLIVQLNWTDNANTETGYILERSTDGVSFSTIATLAADTIFYLDTVPASDMDYYYRLSAENEDNGSSTDPALCATGAISVPIPPVYSSSQELMSSNSDFNLSVFPGKAGYSGLTTGTFGDGTVEAYYFVRNGVFPDLDRYADDGGTVLSGIGNTTFTTNGDFARGDVWTTSDPGTDYTDGDPADFGGSTATVSGGYEVSGMIDISGFTSGTVYVLCGGFDTPFSVTLTMTGGAGSDATGTTTIDPPNSRNVYVCEFPFVSGDYTTINYDYTGSVSNRSSFMGVIVDGDSGGGPSSPYDTWATGYGLENPWLGGNPALNGESDANPDGDPFENLLEFGFAFDPTVSDGGSPLAISGGSITQNGPPQIFEDTGTGQFFLRYTRRSDYVAAGLTYTAQFAADSLGAGAFEDVAGGSVVGTGTGAGGVAIEAVAIEFPDILPVSGKEARFGRVEVTEAP